MLKFILEIREKIMLWKHRHYILSQVNSGMRLGKNVMICPGVKLDPPHSFLTSIGDNCIIAPDVRFLNHDASLFGFAKFAKIGIIDIKENCFVGVGVTLLPGITIGPGSIIGANSVVTADVDADTIVAGNPAKPIGKVSEYVKENRLRMESKVTPSFESEQFYSMLYNADYRAKVLNTMQDKRAFTIGTDKNYKYHFNRI